MWRITRAIVDSKVVAGVEYHDLVTAHDREAFPVREQGEGVGPVPVTGPDQGSEFAAVGLPDGDAPVDLAPGEHGAVRGEGDGPDAP